jgi:hypothetical protein
METTNNKMKVTTTKSNQIKAPNQLNIINNIPEIDGTDSTNNKIKEMMLKDVNTKYLDF